MFRAHVLIIRRSKLHYTASVIITPIGGCLVHRLREDAVLSQPVHETATYRCDDTRGCVMQFWPPKDGHMCSKHVEAWNKLIVKQIFCTSSWLITEINHLRMLALQVYNSFLGLRIYGCVRDWSLSFSGEAFPINNWFNDRATGWHRRTCLQTYPNATFSHHSTVHESACDQTRISGLTGLNLKNTALVAWRSSLFRDVTRRRLIFSHVSERPVRFPENVGINLCCVLPPKSEYLIYVASEAWNHVTLLACIYDHFIPSRWKQRVSPKRS